jgi:hypothetical protein
MTTAIEVRNAYCAVFGRNCPMRRSAKGATSCSDRRRCRYFRLVVDFSHYFFQTNEPFVTQSLSSREENESVALLFIKKRLADTRDKKQTQINNRVTYGPGWNELIANDEP